MTNQRALTTFVTVALAACALLVILTMLSPMIEDSHDVILGDVAITKTCFDRHGYNFYRRWSCRSAFHNIGMTALARGCAFRGDDDFCVTFHEVVRKDNEIVKKNEIVKNAARR